MVHPTFKCANECIIRGTCVEFLNFDRAATPGAGRIELGPLWEFEYTSFPFDKFPKVNSRPLEVNNAECKKPHAT